MDVSRLSEFQHLSKFLTLARLAIMAMISCAVVRTAVAEVPCKTKIHPWVGQLAPELGTCSGRTGSSPGPVRDGREVHLARRLVIRRRPANFPSVPKFPPC